MRNHSTDHEGRRPIWEGKKKAFEPREHRKMSKVLEVECGHHQQRDCPDREAILFPTNMKLLLLLLCLGLTLVCGHAEEASFERGNLDVDKVGSVNSNFWLRECFGELLKPSGSSEGMGTVACSIRQRNGFRPWSKTSCMLFRSNKIWGPLISLRGRGRMLGIVTTLSSQIQEETRPCGIPAPFSLKHFLIHYSSMGIGFLLSWPLTKEKR